MSFRLRVIGTPAVFKARTGTPKHVGCANSFRRPAAVFSHAWPPCLHSWRHHHERKSLGNDRKARGRSFSTLGASHAPDTGKLRRDSRNGTRSGALKKQADDRLTDLLKAANDGTYVDTKKDHARRMADRVVQGVVSHVSGRAPAKRFEGIIMNALLYGADRRHPAAEATPDARRAVLRGRDRVGVHADAASRDPASSLAEGHEGSVDSR